MPFPNTEGLSQQMGQKDCENRGPGRTSTERRLLGITGPLRLSVPAAVIPAQDEGTPHSSLECEGIPGPASRLLVAQSLSMSGPTHRGTQHKLDFMSYFFK